MSKEYLFSTSHNTIFCLLAYWQNSINGLSDAIWETHRIQSVLKAVLCEEILFLIQSPGWWLFTVLSKENKKEHLLVLFCIIFSKLPKENR